MCRATCAEPTMAQGTVHKMVANGEMQVVHHTFQDANQVQATEQRALQEKRPTEKGLAFGPITIAGCAASQMSAQVL